MSDASGTSHQGFPAHSSVLRLTLGGDGVVVRASPAWAGLRGAPVAELEGRPWEMLFLEADRPTVARALEALAEGPAEGVVEARVRLPDGSARRLRWLLAASAETGLVELLAPAPEPGAPEGPETSRAERAAALLGCLPDLVFHLDRDGRFLDVRGGPDSLLYAPPDGPDGFLGSRLAEVLPPELAGRVEAAVVEATESRRVVALDYALELPGRGPRSFEARVAPAGPAEVVVVARDVTEREEARRRLGEQRRDLEEFVASTNFGTWKWNVRTGATRFNERWAEIVGYTLAELEPVSIETWLELAHPEDLPASQAALEAHFAGETAFYDVECRMRHRSGRWVWVHDRGRVVTWTADGAPEWMYGTNADITERVRAGEKLRAREEEFRSLAMNMQDVVVRLDVVGRHLFVNPAAAALVGAHPDALVGRTPREIGLPAPITEVYDRELPRVVAAREPRRGTFSGGFDRRWDYVMIPEPGPEGSVRSILGVFRDITELVEAQQALMEMERRMLHAQRLESLGVLAGGIAHDFNNILTVVRGYTELVLEDLGPGHELAPELESVLDGVTHAAELTRRMLQFSGGEATTRVETDLGELVEGMWDVLRSSVPPDVDLALRRPETPLRVMGAPEQLRQIVTNLVVNAAEAVGTGPGRIDVALRAVPGGWTPSPRAAEGCRALGFQSGSHRLVCLEVGDDGCGMPPEVLDHIFEPFFSTKFQGRGLGLAAVQGIVRGHGGAVYVESEEGRGSVFHLLLPLLEEAPAAPPPEVPRPGEDPGARILVVDDEAPLRRVLSAGLVRAGHRVVEAADGAEALEVLDEAAPDLVLLDLSMPGMDGAACYRELRARRPRLPVVVMSGHAADTVAEHFGDDDPPHLLPKPFSLVDALARVEELLSSAVGAPRGGPGRSGPPAAVSPR